MLLNKYETYLYSVRWVEWISQKLINIVMIRISNAICSMIFIYAVLICVEQAWIHAQGLKITKNRDQQFPKIF